MASHQLAIAKASFSAGLLRPDPTSPSRDEITAFHHMLDRALSHCSPANIQTCKTWLLHHVAPSSNRVAGWAKYLVALAGSLEAEPKSNPSAKRRRLHILYLLNDLFHHSKYHLNTTSVFSTVSGSLQPYIVDLVGHAAAYDRQKHPRHHRRLNDLLDIWSEHGYFSPDFVHKLREVVKNSALHGAAPTSSSDGMSGEADTDKKLPGRDAPFVMPSAHGDPSTPFYDLPAGNLIPHIIPNTTVSVRPAQIKPLQFLAGPADETLVSVLKGFLNDVDRIYDAEDLVPLGEDKDIDQLGQTIIRDEITGDILEGETYYGWSRAFCHQMKRGAPDDSRSRSRSRSVTRNDHKRRRASDSSASRSSRWPRSPSSRSQSRTRGRDVRRRYDSYSRSRSRSRRRSRSRESSYSPRESSPPRFPPAHQPPPLPPFASYQSGGSQPPHLPMGPGTGFPPPPPNYHGAWPPPLPPHMPGMPFPQPGPGIHHAAYPPFPVPPPMPPMARGQPMPPGQHHFPPPHTGPASNPHSGSWGPPAGSHNWR